MSREQAIEQAAKVIADKPDSTMDGRKFFCLYETEVIDKLRSALALPDTAKPVAYITQADSFDVLRIVDEILEANLTYTEETKNLRAFIQKRIKEQLPKADAEP